MIIVDSCSFYILPWSTIIGNMNPIQLKATYSLLQCDHCYFICSAPSWSHHGKTKHLWCLQYIGHYAQWILPQRFNYSLYAPIKLLKLGLVLMLSAPPFDIPYVHAHEPTHSCQFLILIILYLDTSQLKS
jgi:hypothetical protein